MSTSGPTESLPTEVVDALVPAVAACVAELVATVPARPAGALGRLAVPVDPAEERQRSLRNVSSEDYDIRREWPHEDQSPVSSAFDRLPDTLVERLHGALELRIAGLTFDPPLPAAALAELAGPPSTAEEFYFLSMRGQSEAKTALGWVERLHPGATSLVDALARTLADRPEVAARLQVGPDVMDEQRIVEALGAAHVALATATATAVLRATTPDGPPDPAGVVGVALGVAVRLIEEASLPAHYGEARLARRRAEYLLPVHASGWSVAARDHQLALVEGEPPAGVDFSANGLVAPLADGVTVRTGTADAMMNLELLITEDPPTEVELVGWDEVVEVSWTAPSGSAVFTGSGMDVRTPPWPGDYRVRVSARGRDRSDDRESFRFHVWPAPAAPQAVHKQWDLLGHRLRGEPAPDRPEPPEIPHRWIRYSRLGEGATITAVTGATIEDVVRGFGGDPANPISMRMRSQIYDIDPPWIAVTTVDGGIVAIEDNGWEGRNSSVLEALSRSGRAASLYWGPNSGAYLSFARNGALLAGLELWSGMDTDFAPEVRDVLEGLDFEDYRDTIPKGLVAVFRFTGTAFGQEDIQRIEADDVAYLVTRH